MSMIVMVLVSLAVAAIILLAVAGLKAEREKGGEEVISKVYIYLVLFATLMMTIGGSIGAFMAVADIVSPTAYYQSFDEYKRYGGEGKPVPDVQSEVKISDEELLTRYNAMVAAEKDRQMQRAKNSLIKSFGWIVIPLPVFVYFQRRLAKKD